MDWINDPQAWIALATLIALSFLILIGVTLIGEGAGFHIPKGYIYFAMAFSVMVEMLNLRVKATGRAVGPIQLRSRYASSAGDF